MERYLRIAGPVAVVGLVLSILVGAFAGIPFGTVVLRGIVSAIVFGGGGVGLAFVIERFLPGLFDTDVAGSAGGAIDSVTAYNDGADDEPPAAGSRLDIVVEDEDGDEEAGTGLGIRPASERSESGGNRTDEDILEPVEGLEPLAETTPSEEKLSSKDSAYRSGESSWKDSTAVAGPSGAGSEDDTGEPVEELVEEVEEQSAENAEALMNEAIAEEKYGGGVEIDDTVLDEMPDIGSFSGSFVGSSPSDSDDDNSFADPFASDGGAPRRKGGANKPADDPTIVAKALQTMLSRDEKE